MRNNKAMKVAFTAFCGLLYSICACSWLLFCSFPYVAVPAVIAAVAINLFAAPFSPGIIGARLRQLDRGVGCLEIFVVSVVFSTIFHIVLLAVGTEWKTLIISAAVCTAAEAILFWNGIITVYATSVQLGLKIRVIGVVCGPIPIAHLFALRHIVRVCSREVRFESEKEALDRLRQSEAVCRTKYPLLFVHGVFFRDTNVVNYWGRIPKELERNGATIYYGNHSSALSIEDSGRELYERIKHIVTETGCEKVNVIAHSKGGLDCRAAIAMGASPMVASLTTINTPHRGCLFADELLSRIPESVQRKVERAYNAAAHRLGDPSPDFMAACRDLTADRCREFDASHPVPDGVFCQSTGSRVRSSRGGKLPLNLTYGLVRHFDGENDGLVSVDSFKWGRNYIFLEPIASRGISHADMIDLNRENIEGFDVREFYVRIVSDLKNKGL